MNEILDKQLCEKYPLLFKDRNGDMRTTAMVWGFCHGDGWAESFKEPEQTDESSVTLDS